MCHTLSNAFSICPIKKIAVILLFISVVRQIIDKPYELGACGVISMEGVLLFSWLYESIESEH